MDEKYTEYKNYIIQRLCSCVPNRKDIHEKIKGDIENEPIKNTLEWIKRLHAPKYDYKIDEFKNITNIDELFKILNEHIDIMMKEIKEAKEKILKGEPLYKPKSTNGIPDIIKTGI